eukprot:3696573-Prymnesium_polylepis.2
MGSPGVVWGRMESYGVTRGHMGSRGVTWGHMGSHGVTWQVEPLGHLVARAVDLAEGHVAVGHPAVQRAAGPFWQVGARRQRESLRVELPRLEQRKVLEREVACHVGGSRGVTWGHVGSRGVTCVGVGVHGHVGVPWGHMGYRVTWGHMGSHGVTWGHM